MAAPSISQQSSRASVAMDLSYAKREEAINSHLETISNISSRQGHGPWTGETTVKRYFSYAQEGDEAAGSPGSGPHIGEWVW